VVHSLGADGVVGQHSDCFACKQAEYKESRSNLDKSLGMVYPHYHCGSCWVVLDSFVSSAAVAAIDPANRQTILMLHRGEAPTLANFAPETSNKSDTPGLGPRRKHANDSDFKASPVIPLYSALSGNSPS